MGARRNFIEDHLALQEASDLQLLVDASLSNRTRAKLISGIAVGAFISIEQFLMNRTAELSHFASSGATYFTDLERGSRRLILARTAQNFLASLNQSQSTEADWIAAATDVAQSVHDIDARPLSMGPIVLSWSGSNLQAKDVEDLLRILGCSAKHWESMTAVLRRVLRGQQVIVKTAFDAVANARHRAAHASSASISVTELRTLPQHVLNFCIAFDCLASHLALEIQRGRISQLPNPVQRIVNIRFVEPTQRAWRHISEGRQRGNSFTSFQDAWAAATQVAGQSEETVVRLDDSGTPIDWMPAFCP